MLNTGIKISQYPDGPVDDLMYKNKLTLNHHFITYAPSHYGAKFINKNYKVSLDSLQKDMVGYIGVRNAKPSYLNYIDFWSGYWFDKDDRTNSYAYVWENEHRYNDDYVPDKFGKAQDKSIDKIFILKSAPLPLEAEDSRFSSHEDKNLQKDPAENTTKIVDKNYVDDRHNGFRKVPITETKLSIRPYTCYYQYSNLIPEDESGIRTINICDDVKLENGKKLSQKLKNNRLMFYVRITNNEAYYIKDGSHFNNLRFLVNGKDEVKWSYEGELAEILRESRIQGDSTDNKDFIFIRFEAEYENEKFVISGTNFFGRGKHAKRMVEMQPDSTTGLVKEIYLSLHENESFITQIPQKDIQVGITFNTEGLNDYHEYSWDYFVITPDMNSETGRTYDNVIFENTGTDIMWAMSDNFNEAPTLEPNRLYCFEFIKAFDSVLIGRIKYYVNLVKKN